MNEVTDYDLHWKESNDVYNNHPTSLHRQRFVLNSLKDYAFTDETTVFDYGCGSGIILERISERYGVDRQRLNGCDLSFKAIENARKAFNSDGFFCGEFPATDKMFDIVICTEVIEHTSEYERILDWVTAHIRQGGVFVLTTQGNPMDRADRNYGHIQQFELNQLMSLLNDRGFEIPYASRWGFPGYSLQKKLTCLFFDHIRKNFMLGTRSPSKRFLFSAVYHTYKIHDFIPYGPQIFIRARKKI